MVSLKQNARDAAKRMGMLATSPGKSKKPSYPWGTSMNLEQPELQKLKIPATAKVGDTVHIRGKARVTGHDQSESEDGGPRRSMRLQMTDMEAHHKAKGSKGAKKAFAKMSGKKVMDDDGDGY